LQIIKPKVSRARHKMVAKQIGALTVNEKVYANWRKISVIAKKYREENFSLEQLEKKILTELPKLTKRDIRYALRMLPSWRMLCRSPTNRVPSRITAMSRAARTPTRCPT